MRETIKIKQCTDKCRNIDRAYQRLLVGGIQIQMSVEYQRAVRTTLQGMNPEVRSRARDVVARTTQMVLDTTIAHCTSEARVLGM